MHRFRTLDLTSDQEQRMTAGLERASASHREDIASADRQANQWGEIVQEPFCVTFDTPVAFSRNAFCPDNPRFRDVLCRREPHKRHRIAIFIDDGVSAAWPEITELIRCYAA